MFSICTCELFILNYFASWKLYCPKGSSWKKDGYFEVKMSPDTSQSSQTESSTGNARVKSNYRAWIQLAAWNIIQNHDRNTHCQLKSKAINIYEIKNKMPARCVCFSQKMYNSPSISNTIHNATLQPSQPFKKTVPEINYLYEKDLHDNTWAGVCFIELKKAIFSRLKFNLSSSSVI